MTAAPPILYLTHRVPYPPDKGDRIRNYHVLRELAARGRVWLACLADEPVPDATRAALAGLCERVEIVPVSGKMRWLRAGWSLIRGRSLTEGAFAEPRFARTLKGMVFDGKGEFSAVVVSASSLAPYLGWRFWKDMSRVIDLVDVDSQKWFDFAASARPPKRWLYRLEGRRVRELEQRLAETATAVTIVSRAECDVFDSFTRPGRGTVATNGVDLDYFRPRPGTPTVPACAFVGAMDYLPNIDGAVWFARDIWPRIRATYPTAEFRVIGRKPAPAVAKLAELPGVIVTGSVPDVRPFVATASVAVCPIRIARGLQNKVLEAMAMAKPTVAAPAAIAALGVTVGTHLLSPTTPDEWVRDVSELFDNAAKRAELGNAARKYVEEHHHWDRCLKPLVDAVFGSFSDSPLPWREGG